MILYSVLLRKMKLYKYYVLISIQRERTVLVLYVHDDLLAQLFRERHNTRLAAR